MSSADDVRRIRDEQEIGIHEARIIAERRAMERDLAEATTLEALKPILLRLIHGYRR